MISEQWGYNPLLAPACENHVYLVRSTYETPEHDWMISAILDHTGAPNAHVKQRGAVAVAEVDLNARTLSGPASATSAPKSPVTGPSYRRSLEFELLSHLVCKEKPCL